MAESQSMTSAGVVAKALIEEHSDFLRESVAMIATQIMEAEIERQIGAGKGEVSEEDRPTATATGSGPGRQESGRSSWRCPANAPGRATSRASWSPAKEARRPCSGWSWRPT